MVWLKPRSKINARTLWRSAIAFGTFVLGYVTKIVATGLDSVLVCTAHTGVMYNPKDTNL